MAAGVMDQLPHREQHSAPQNDLDPSGSAAAASHLHGQPGGRVGAVEQRAEGPAGGGSREEGRRGGG